MSRRCTIEETLRRDARRNREKILAAASDLFASQGSDTQMDQIASHAGLGVGSLYRHFPNKQALLTAIVRKRFQGMSELARSAEEIDDARSAFETILYRYLEAAEGDAAFQWAMLGSNGLEWDGVREEKTEFADIVTRIIDRAVADGSVRSDLTYADFPVMTCGVMSTMYFKPTGNPEWRRHVALLLEGVIRRDIHHVLD